MELPYSTTSLVTLFVTAIIIAVVLCHCLDLLIWNWQRNRHAKKLLLEALKKPLRPAPPEHFNCRCTGGVSPAPTESLYPMKKEENGIVYTKASASEPWIQTEEWTWVHTASAVLWKKMFTMTGAPYDLDDFVEWVREVKKNRQRVKRLDAFVTSQRTAIEVLQKEQRTREEMHADERKRLQKDVAALEKMNLEMAEKISELESTKSKLTEELERYKSPLLAVMPGTDKAVLPSMPFLASVLCEKLKEITAPTANTDRETSVYGFVREAEFMANELRRRLGVWSSQTTIELEALLEQERKLHHVTAHELEDLKGRYESRGGIITKLSNLRSAVKHASSVMNDTIWKLNHVSPETEPTKGYLTEMTQRLRDIDEAIKLSPTGKL